MENYPDRSLIKYVYIACQLSVGNYPDCSLIKYVYTACQLSAEYYPDSSLIKRVYTTCLLLLTAVKLAAMLTAVLTQTWEALFHTP